MKMIEVIRHSLAHVLAAAVKKLSPGAILGIGPSVEAGFYYDIQPAPGSSIDAESLGGLGKEMRRIISQNLSFEKEDLTIDQAKTLFSQAGETFKCELIDDLGTDGNSSVTVYRLGPFVDLCRGPHVESTRQLASVAFKLDRVSGAYWKGSSDRPMLQRVYGLAFETAPELAEYLQRREDAIRKDHRKIGAQLELFMTSELIGRGLPILLPKGATIRRILERFVVDEELKRGYQHVYTPSLGRRHLYEISGHWEHYKDSMYPPMTIADEEMVLRPMTCPHHFMIYQHRPRSYRELPMRIAEIASQFRREQSGELSGLVRIMSFTLADAHIFCTPEQVSEEFQNVVALVQFIMKSLGVEPAIAYQASLRDDSAGKFVDNPPLWEKAEAILLDTLRQGGIEHTVARGEAAFYGPKLDVQMRNVMGKAETVFTVQIDFALPDRFALEYIDSQGQPVRPV
ncbi:MAG: threonine--tRNA ligase, partial [Planctomycetes bacterium]|nr:threonine--tRNA ligase [Planctomycetota bacterium]